MKKVSELQYQIKSSIAFCFLSLGFDISRSPTFYDYKENVVRIVHIDFLNKTNVQYFNTNSASFTLNLGVFLNFENLGNIFPKEYECQIRGVLLKDFRQKSPMNLSGFSFFHPERRRKDIWWVEKDGSNLDDLLVNANRIIKRNALKWLNRFSDFEYLGRYLKSEKEVDAWKGGPFGFGAIGSPFREDVIRKLENRKWRR